MITFHKIYTDTGLRHRALLMDMIVNEHQRQCDKFGRQRHSLPTWLTIAAEEHGELAKAINEFRLAKLPTNNHLIAIKKEAIQAATVCLKIADFMIQEQESRRNHAKPNKDH